MDLPVSRAVARVIQDAAGAPGAGLVELPTLGGSVPMYLFVDNLKAPTVGIPIVNHDNNQHAANENLRLQNLWDGIETCAALLTASATLALILGTRALAALGVLRYAQDDRRSGTIIPRPCHRGATSPPCHPGERSFPAVILISKRRRSLEVGIEGTRALCSGSAGLSLRALLSFASSV